MPGPGQREHTFIENLSEGQERLGDVDHFISRAATELVDGNTDWDRRVKDLAALIRVANREMHQIMKEYRKNNPEPVRTSEPFTGFGNFKK